MIDEFAVIKSVQTDQFNHAPRQLYLQTGTPQFGGASIGSWATYGLGSENQDLPGFVVLTSGGKTPDAGKSVWGAGSSPRSTKESSAGRQAIRSSSSRTHRAWTGVAGRETLDTLKLLNDWQAEAIGDPETVTRIAHTSWPTGCRPRHPR